MTYNSDSELSLDSKKLRKIFDEEASVEEETGNERNRDLVDEYSQGYKRLKKMRLDENMWQD